MRTLTVGQVLDAIEENGYRKKTGLLIDWAFDGTNVNRHKRPIGACAIGQGAINLDIHSGELQLALRDVKIPPIQIKEGIVVSDVGACIYSLNDLTGMSVSNIAKKVRNSLSQETLNTEIPVFEYHNYLWKEEA